MRTGPISMPGRLSCALVAGFVSVTQQSGAQVVDSSWIYTPTECPGCSEWNAPTAPFRVFGNTYFVGTRGLTALLVAGDAGHVLLDAGLPASAPLIMANVRALGFRVEDIKVIAHSHAHFDHVGGIAALQLASGAEIVASPWSARTLNDGRSGPDDPQYGGAGAARGRPRIALAFPRVTRTRLVRDGERITVGSLVLIAHFTAGHTPGGTTWTWRSCDGNDCVDLVYADSQTPVSADDFLFTKNIAYPTAIRDFELGFSKLEALRCDILLTPHPGASRFWPRVEAYQRGQTESLRDPEQCRRYAADARRQLTARIATESKK